MNKTLHIIDIVGKRCSSCTEEALVSRPLPHNLIGFGLPDLHEFPSHQELPVIWYGLSKAQKTSHIVGTLAQGY